MTFPSLHETPDGGPRPRRHKQKYYENDDGQNNVGQKRNYSIDEAACAIPCVRQIDWHAALPIDIFRWLGFTREQYENNLTVGDARTGDSSRENECESRPRIPFSSDATSRADFLIPVLIGGSG